MMKGGGWGNFDKMFSPFPSDTQPRSLPLPFFVDARNVLALEGLSRYLLDVLRGPTYFMYSTVYTTYSCHHRSI